MEAQALVGQAVEISLNAFREQDCADLSSFPGFKGNTASDKWPYRNRERGKRA